MFARTALRLSLFTILGAHQALAGGGHSTRVPSDPETLKEEVRQMAQDSGLTPAEVIQGLKQSLTSMPDTDEEEGKSIGSIVEMLTEVEVEFGPATATEEGVKPVAMVPAATTPLSPIPTPVAERVTEKPKTVSKTNESRAVVTSAPPIYINASADNNPNISVQTSLKAMMQESNEKSPGSNPVRIINAPVVSVAPNFGAIVPASATGEDTVARKFTLANLLGLLKGRAPASATVPPAAAMPKADRGEWKQARWRYPLAVTSANDSPADKAPVMASPILDVDPAGYESWFGWIGWIFAFGIVFALRRYDGVHLVTGQVSKLLGRRKARPNKT